MALLFCDGFDHYASADLLKKWDSLSGTVIIGAYGRNSTNGFYFNMAGSTQKFGKSLGVNCTTIIVGMAIQSNSGGSSAGTTSGFLVLLDGATKHLSVYHSATDISVYQGNGTLLGTATGALPTGTYVYLEIKATIHDTTGSVELRVDGATVLNLTNIDTRNAGNAYIDNVTFASTVYPSSTQFDDIYICDTTGSINNDFLGDVIIETIYPNADGTNSGWTALGAGNHYVEVDDASQDGDTSYVSTSTASARDTYALQNLSTTAGGAVKAVAINVMAEKDGTTTRGIKPVVKSSATYAQGAELTLSLASYVNAQYVLDADPATSAAWTESAVNAMEAGVDLTT